MTFYSNNSCNYGVCHSSSFIYSTTSSPWLYLQWQCKMHQTNKKKITCINVIIIELLEFSIACHPVLLLLLWLFSCWWCFTMYVCVMSHKFYFCVFFLFKKSYIFAAFIVRTYDTGHAYYKLLSAFFTGIWLCFMFNLFVCLSIKKGE